MVIKHRYVGKTNAGFTLIGFLIALVVLGVATVIVFSSRNSPPPPRAGTGVDAAALATCQSSGYAIASAVTAFRIQNPGVQVTQALLTNRADGGPYLQFWPLAPPSYVYRLHNGVLQIATAPTGAIPGIRAYSNYISSEDCSGTK